MSSRKRNDQVNPPLDLERGLKVTADDVRALRAAQPGPMTVEEYLRWVAQFPAPSYEELRRRPGPARGPMFRLP
jgi:hypothetical protein